MSSKLDKIINEGKGLALIIPVANFQDLKAFVLECVQAGIVRCTSPNRTGLCDSPATTVFWQDQAEWYPCCEEHRVPGPMWTGSTRLSSNQLELLVDPQKIKGWLIDLEPDMKQRVRFKVYDRAVILRVNDSPRPSVFSETEA